ncbi:MAG: hypothetical protein ACLQB4_10290 [Beijerinckiaceae bacterium]
METLTFLVVLGFIAVCAEIYIAAGQVVTQLQTIHRELKPTHHPVELAGVVLTTDENLADGLIAAIRSLEKAVVKSN